MAAKGLFISQTGQGFTVRGINNNFFPDNATLAYPANSVILITDDSNMATFRSASNYDVLFSALIKDININEERVTKDNIIETFNEVANKPMGGGGDITGLFADAAYDEREKKIEFYDIDGNEVASIDATDFIKDGMVSNVEISNGNLVITFNTDAGKNAISIPLTDIFNPSNYYDKTAVDTKLALKADTANVYDKTAMDAALALKADASNVYTKTETDSALGNKANSADVYTKTAVDEKLADYVDIDTYNGKELATAKALTQLNDTKADKTELPDVSTLATKTELNAKANSADLATVATSGSYDDLTNKPVIPEGVTVDAALSDTSENPVQNKVVKGVLDAKQDTISDLATIRSGAALGATAYQKPSTGIPASDIADGVIPTVPTNVSAFTNDAGYLTQHQSLDNYYTKTQVDTALAAKVSQTEFDTKEEVISTALNTLNGNFGGMKLMRISSADYEALQTKDSNTLYIITGSNS